MVGLCNKAVPKKGNFWFQEVISDLELISEMFVLTVRIWLARLRPHLPCVLLQRGGNGKYSKCSHFLSFTPLVSLFYLCLLFLSLPSLPTVDVTHRPDLRPTSQHWIYLYGSRALNLTASLLPVSPDPASGLVDFSLNKNFVVESLCLNLSERSYCACRRLVERSQATAARISDRHNMAIAIARLAILLALHSW